MKKYEVVNNITTDTYSLEPGSGVWTEQMLLDHGLTLEDIRDYKRTGDLFEITFANPEPLPPT